MVQGVEILYHAVKLDPTDTCIYLIHLKSESRSYKGILRITRSLDINNYNSYNEHFGTGGYLLTDESEIEIYVEDISAAISEQTYLYSNVGNTIPDNLNSIMNAYGYFGFNGEEEIPLINVDMPFVEKTVEEEIVPKYDPTKEVDLFKWFENSIINIKEKAFWNTGKKDKYTISGNIYTKEEVIYVTNTGTILPKINAENPSSNLEIDFLTGCYIDLKGSIYKYITEFNPDFTIKTTNYTYVNLSNCSYLVYIREYNAYIQYCLIKDPNYSFIKEDLSRGQYKLTESTFTKKLRIEGDKYELDPINTFKNKTINKPITYNKTFGKKYSFGIELEVISGIMPYYLTNEIAFESVHDGSLRDPEDGNSYGKEMVTDVLKGDLGLLETNKLTAEVEKRCMINHQCSLHNHLGGINFNKENVILLYFINQLLQDEVFKILPPSRRNNEYCKKLPNIFEWSDVTRLTSLEDREYTMYNLYSELIKYFSRRSAADRYINKKKDHPSGFKCGYNHNTARYDWVNFIPAVFNTRNNGVYTLEYRAFNGTNSYRDVKNWLMLCMGIVDLVENHKQYIYSNIVTKQKFDLATLLQLVYPNNYRHLVSWCEDRKVIFGDKNFDEKEFYKNMNYKENNKLLKLSEL